MPLRDDLLNPIPGDNPSGENLYYSPIYDKIKEARRQDDDAPQGEWQRERKVADWPLVIKLTGEALATQSKDLQLAVWLTEAMVRREGFPGFSSSLELLRGLVENFWDTLYPELEDGEAEFRATPLEWVSTKFDDLVRQIGLVKGGHSFLRYKESRTVPTEEVAGQDDAKAEARQAAIAEKKLTPEEFDKAVELTSLESLEKLLGEIDACLEAIDALSEACEPRFGEFTPSFGRLKETIQEVRVTVNGFYRKKGGGQAPVEAEPEPEPEAAAESSDDWSSGWSQSEPAAAATAAAPARAKAPRKVTSAEPADAEDAALRLAAVAKFLRAQDAYNPSPYLMLRGFRWGEVRASAEYPDANLYEAPNSDTRRTLRQMANDGQWQELIEVAEEAMAEPSGRAWLDLQRYVVRACTEMGYTAIATAIKSELGALLKDIPSLTTAVMVDDTPTANPETQEWLKAEVQTAEAAPAPTYYEAPSSWSAPVEESASEEALEAPPDAFKLAMDAVQAGRLQEGISILVQELSREGSGRGRFQRQLQIAQLCLANGHDGVALPILEQLVQLIDKHGLEEWESADLVAHALTLLHACLGRAERPPEERRRIYERLCRLSPLQALAASH